MTSRRREDRPARPRTGAAAKGSAVALLALCAAFLPACERGCATTWLREHAVGGRAPPTSAASFPINAVDCPDGLGRCIGGVVEVSRVSHYELPCTGAPETCICPWDPVGDCPRGCAAEGVEVVVPRDRAFAQLCAPDPADRTEAFARPLVGAPAPAGACEVGGFRCVASVVVACRGAPLNARAVAACLHGCAHDGDAIDEEDVSDEAAARILCAR